MPSNLRVLATHVPSLQGSGIVYTLTVRDAVQVAGWLQSRGIRAESYSGESGVRRVELEQALLQNRVKALVATTALGMGFDKPDLAFVIHYQTPGSVVAYYQQVGRAGRQLGAARGVLLSGQEESDINDYFIESAFPSREGVASVQAALRMVAELFETVRAILMRELVTPRPEEEVVKLLAVTKPQARAWLARLVEAAVLEKVTNLKPLRYRTVKAAERLL